MIMENNEDSILPSTSSEQEDTSQKGSVVDMMLGKSNEKVVDSETMIQETQKRIWSSLKKGIEYDATVDRSDAYLRQHVHEKQSMVVMYVDLVGSTDITLTLPEEKVAIIISSFAQEMAFAVKHHGGFVLKFVGDAVIGYFVHASSLIAADNAISAGKSMIKIIQDLNFKGSFNEFFKFLRTDDQFYAKTPKELLMYARDISKRADEQLPKKHVQKAGQCAIAAKLPEPTVAESDQKGQRRVKPEKIK